MKHWFARRRLSQPATPAVPATVSLPSHGPVSLQPKFMLPPLPHPHPYASINVLVTPDGLMLRPNTEGLGDAVSYVRISWGKDVVVEAVKGDVLDWAASTTVYGIVGILRLFNASYLLVITTRSHVGDLFDESRAVFRVDGVSAIPLEVAHATATVNMLASQPISLSRTLLSAPRADFVTKVEHETRSEASEDVQAHEGVSSSPQVRFVQEQKEFAASVGIDGLDVPNLPSPTSSGSSTPNAHFTTSPVAKALAMRLSFWSRLSKRVSSGETPTLEGSPASTTTIDNLERCLKDGEHPTEVLDSILAAAAPPPTAEERHYELDDKVVRETIKEFSKGGMYFSYHFDITTSLQHKQQLVEKLKRRSTLLSDLQALEEQPRVWSSSEQADQVDAFVEPHATLPLWRRADRKFWWNESLSRPFIDAGLHSYVLPIMQGYYQIASFRVPSIVFTTPVSEVLPNRNSPNELGNESDGHLVGYVLISRRSRDRAGLRYQRRGLDDDANVANFVETETIMRIKREDRINIFSFVQIRGSIPLFWTQPGYGLKPAPQISSERTHDQTIDALQRHFKRVVTSYGPFTIINLAEQHGKEGVLTAAYRESVQELNMGEIRYHEYDFHAETKGMRYENISKLIGELERMFESHGFFWVSDGVIMSQQRGVFRVNCIDCLDRTNVVQSAFARHALHNQLEAVAVLNSNVAGDKSHEDIVFNDVWANNGDAISRAYAGTSALKGDFTRTGKRDLGGLINDGLNSLSRVYTSTFSDWFSQAVIDFMLGNRTLSVFSEFLLKLSSTDPRELIRISKIRAAAIETCASRVLSEDERQIAGWTLLSPVELSMRLGDKFEEKVLLLTAKALYMVSYDYSLEKVKRFTRIPLGDIVGITKGVYILSPLEEASRNPADNYGLVISYLPSRLTTRVTSYSLHNTVGTIPLQLAGTAQRLSRILTVPSRHMTALSQILYPTLTAPGAIVSAAFKALPVDHAAQVPADIEDPVATAPTCRDAIDVMVDMVQRACIDVGSGTPDGFVCEKDIVSLAEAQRMTTVFAKLEYNFKRLLWLGS